MVERPVRSGGEIVSSDDGKTPAADRAASVSIRAMRALAYWPRAKAM